jgi:leucyl aminopeptidase
MSIEVVTTDEAFGKVECDALLVGCSPGDGSLSLNAAGTEVDDAFDGYLMDQLHAQGFKGKVGDFFLMPTFDRVTAYAVGVVGTGEPTKDRSNIRRAAAVAARKLSNQAVIATALHDDDASGQASIEGLLLGNYRFGKYKQSSPKRSLERVIACGVNAQSAERARIHAEAASLARDLINEPADVLTPDAFARRAQAIADETGLECNIWDVDELEARGCGGILGVGKGSENAPKLIVLHYEPAGSTSKVALVGKGVTFDSGGLSLKPFQSMEEMKTDMAGGAAVIAAMSVLGKLGIKTQVTAYIPAVENMPSGSAIKPGDVITHYGGRTVEVVNTDAEGRLILADALAIACEEKPAAVIDVATLTGTIIVALGHKATGLFATDDALADDVLAASEAAGERMWRMPIYDDYKSNLDSMVADMKNSGTRYGGAINAAVFLKESVDPSVPWVHLDIAGTGRADSDRDEISRGGTGVATRTLLRWLQGRER